MKKLFSQFYFRIVVFAICSIISLNIFCQSNNEFKWICIDQPTPEGYVITAYSIEYDCPDYYPPPTTKRNAKQIRIPEEFCRICLDSPIPKGYIEVNGERRTDLSCTKNGYTKVESKLIKKIAISNTTSSSFNLHKSYEGMFSYIKNGFRVDKHPRIVADVNGDGRDDIIGFGNNAVHVALGQNDGSFSSPILAFDRNFLYNRGEWRVDKNPRFVADVNGDGRGDIVGFGNIAVYVALGRSNGTFENPIIAYDKSFVYNKGNWRVDKHPRYVADVNGDGKADIIGFGNDVVSVALGKSDGTFKDAKIAFQESFTYRKGYWKVDKHPRTVVDVNGDGKADIVGFGNDAVSVALGNSNGTFSSIKVAYNKSFVYSKGWRVDKHPRLVADVNGDGRGDIVGFGNNKVYVALGQSDGSFSKDFAAYDKNFTIKTGSWFVSRHPRTIGDVNGDGKGDIIGFGNVAVFVSLK